MSERRSARSLILHAVLGAAVVSLTGVAVSTSDVRTVRIEDRCDPATFDAAIAPGTCVGDGDETFDEFLAELADDQEARHWRFKEDEFDARVGDAVNTFNIGGEVHSFTRVAAFGGGVVPLLNDLSGNPVIAPECANFVPILPGASGNSTVLSTSGVQRFQCCIHPWMRTEVTVRRR